MMQLSDITTVLSKVETYLKNAGSMNHTSNGAGFDSSIHIFLY